MLYWTWINFQCSRNTPMASANTSAAGLPFSARYSLLNPWTSAASSGTGTSGLMNHSQHSKTLPSTSAVATTNWMIRSLSASTPVVSQSARQ